MPDPIFILGGPVDGQVEGELVEAEFADRSAVENQGETRVYFANTEYFGNNTRWCKR